MAKIKDKGKKPKKKGQKKYIFSTLAALVGLVVWYGMQPMKGTIHVGICRTFVELQLQFPHTMRISLAETFERSQRLFYTYLDGFGEQKSDYIDCRFIYPFTTPNYAIERITINNTPVPQDVVDRFNKSLPGILAANPSLVVPFPPGDDLRLLKTDP